jgi:hypothetical protein
LRCLCGQHEDAGTDDGANAKQHQADRPKGAAQRMLLRCFQNGVNRLDTSEH